jgi:hypothetical protein
MLDNINSVSGNAGGVQREAGPTVMMTLRKQA